MLDDDDDSHLPRETNPRHVIALINLHNLYFVSQTQKTDDTKPKEGED